MIMIYPLYCKWLIGIPVCLLFCAYGYESLSCKWLIEVHVLWTLSSGASTSDTTVALWGGGG